MLPFQISKRQHPLAAKDTSLVDSIGVKYRHHSLFLPFTTGNAAGVKNRVQIQNLMAQKKRYRI
jgi:hypothetical protein